jgi:hypothetical protein
LMRPWMRGVRFRHLPRHRRSPPRHPRTSVGFLHTSALIRLCWTTPSSGSISACHAGSWRGWMRRPERRVNRAPVTSPISRHWAEQSPCGAEPMLGCCSRVAQLCKGIHAWRGSTKGARIGIQ